jgi:hypothetical protein
MTVRHSTIQRRVAETEFGPTARSPRGHGSVRHA